MAVKVDKQKRPLYEIAKEIRQSWGSKVYFGAKTYIGIMATLNKITDKYMCDDAETIVRYFLANASTWKGDDAKRIKAELKSML